MNILETRCVHVIFCCVQRCHDVATTDCIGKPNMLLMLQLSLLWKMFCEYKIKHGVKDINFISLSYGNILDSCSCRFVLREFTINRKQPVEATLWQREHICKPLCSCYFPLCSRCHNVATTDCIGKSNMLLMLQLSLQWKCVSWIPNQTWC